MVPLIHCIVISCIAKQVLHLKEKCPYEEITFDEIHEWLTMMHYILTHYKIDQIYLSKFFQDLGLRIHSKRLPCIVEDILSTKGIFPHVYLTFQ